MAWSFLQVTSDGASVVFASPDPRGADRADIKQAVGPGQAREYARWLDEQTAPETLIKVRDGHRTAYHAISAAARRELARQLRELAAGIEGRATDAPLALGLPTELS